MADLAAALQQEFGIPVIDGIDAAVRLAELLAASGLCPSKRHGWAYHAPAISCRRTKSNSRQSAKRSYVKTES
ncbi:MAG TPA: hypothetical protein VN284_10955 [Rhizobium sp.]|uniref:hypothetical protein n=1 Tax=Rhizobium sp. F40D2 TaxID=3453141 RepID=UPI002C3E8FD8|nr:hypothetical protein [Rhizobium sp.]